MGIRKSRAIAVALGLGLCLALLGAGPALAETGGIAGRVIEAEEAEGVASATVCAEAAPPLAPASTCVETEGSGAYEILGLEAGQYRVHFEPPPESRYVPQYYVHSLLRNSARLLQVEEGSVKQGVSASLEAGGWVTGTVTDTLGVSLGDIDVCVSNLLLPELVIPCDKTNLEGKYTVLGLPPGPYTAFFSAAESRSIFPQYFSGARLASEANTFYVFGYNETPDIDVKLALGVTISGTVAEAGTGLPLNGIRVCALSAASEAEVRCVASRSDGRYEIFGLHRGTYVVGFSVGRSSVPAGEDAFVRQYYEDKATFAAADRIDASGPGVFQDIDAHLTRGPEIFPVTAAPSAAAAAAPTEASTPPKRCRKGFRKKLVKGTKRCVRVKHRKQGKRQGGRQVAHHPTKSR